MRHILLGHFHPAALRYYLALKTLIFWGLIALCWFSYPADHHYAISTHTFSFLGSFSEERNPRWWWLFTVAMLFWSVALVPLIAYTYRRFARISRPGAAVGAGLFGLGAAGIALVALFPDVSTPVFGATRWTDIHEKAAVLVAVGFILGIPWHALLLLKSRIFLRGASGFRHRRFMLPYLLWTAMLLTAGYFQIRWEVQYRVLKEAAIASGNKIGSSWSESLGTINGFPFWENVVIYTLFLFLGWFALALPNDIVNAGRVNEHT